MSLALVVARPVEATSASEFTQVQDFAISADGSRIAFTVRATANGETPGLYVADRDGTDAVRLADDGRHPDFSPDGQQLVFSRSTAGGSSDLFLVPTTGGPPVNLTTSPGTERDPRFSPDGATAVVVSGPSGSGSTLPDVTLVGVTTGAETVLLTVPTGASSPAFTADGTAVLYVAWDGVASQQIFRAPVTGGPPTQLTHFDTDHFPAAVESSRAPANSGQILFVDTDTSIDVLATDGTVTEARSSTTDAFAGVHWTPAGRIAFLSFTIPPAGPPPTVPTGPPTTGPPTTPPPPPAGPATRLVIPLDPTTATVAAGGSVSSAPEATPLVPVATSVTSPVAGPVTIDTTTTDVAPPAGYTFLGEQVTVTAPAATAAVPLTLTFRIDAARLASAGVNAATVVVFRDGVPMADCAPATTAANPDPCVGARSTLPDGNAQLAVRTSHASRWNLAAGPPVVPGPRATTVTVACSPSRTTVFQRTTKCTAVVTDVAGGTPSRPAGTVTFTSTGLGTRIDPRTCTLAATGQPGAAASCRVSVTPWLALLRSRTDTVTASFRPDPAEVGAHAAGRGTTTVLVQGLLVR